MPSQILKSVSATLTTGANNGDGLDDDSSLCIVLHPTTSGVRSADYLFYGRDGTGGSTHERDIKTFDLTMLTSTLTKSQINHIYSIDAIINAVGRDHYAGHLQLIFHFDDNTIAGFVFDFAIGTFHESNQTGKVIDFDLTQFVDKDKEDTLWEIYKERENEFIEKGRL